MPIVSPIPFAHPLSDGRQSDRAMMVRRGVQRMFAVVGAHVMPELTLAGGRRADLVVIDRKSSIWIVEIKTSVEDFRVDRKWPEYRLHSDRLYFATHPDVPLSIFPDDCGLILSDGYEAEILREAPEHRLSAPARRAMTLRIARTGAARLTSAELSGFDIKSVPGEAE